MLTGTAKKIFEDRTDSDSVQLLMPEFKTQERLALRTTLVQMTKERTATIYAENSGLGLLAPAVSLWAQQHELDRLTPDARRLVFLAKGQRCDDVAILRQGRAKPRHAVHSPARPTTGSRGAA